MRRKVKDYKGFIFWAEVIAVTTAMTQLQEGRSGPTEVAGYRLERRPDGLVVASRQRD